MMIKDNHVDAAGGVKQAIERAHAYQKEKGLSLGITLEVRNLVEVEEGARKQGGLPVLCSTTSKFPFSMKPLLL
jgi:nicotinate-nucleotide pyrophosphorylase (carboxylating)